VTALRVATVDQDATLCRLEQAVELADEGRLAGAVLAHDRDALAVRDRERDGGKSPRSVGIDEPTASTSIAGTAAFALASPRRLTGSSPRCERGRIEPGRIEPGLFEGARVERGRIERGRIERNARLTSGRGQLHPRWRPDAQRTEAGSARISDASPGEATRPASRITTRRAMRARRSVLCSASRIPVPASAARAARASPTSLVPCGRAAMWLVKHEIGRPQGENGRQGDQLRLATRQPLRISRRQVGNAQRGHRPVDSVHHVGDRQPQICGARRRPPPNVAAGARQLGHGILKEDAATLRELVRLEADGLGAIDRDRTFEPAPDDGRREARGNEAQGALSGVVRACQPTTCPRIVRSRLTRTGRAVPDSDTTPERAPCASLPRASRLPSSGAGSKVRSRSMAPRPSASSRTSSRSVAASSFRIP